MNEIRNPKDLDFFETDKEALLGSSSSKLFSVSSEARPTPTAAHPFRVVSDFAPAGDQPNAVQRLADGVEAGHRFQTLLGITGSGKNATIAWAIEKVQQLWCGT